MRRISTLAAVAAVSGLLLVAAGCGGLRKTVTALLPPHTTIFVDGPLDPVNHTAHLHWFGSTPNGYIAGYELRLLNPSAPADTAWRFTTRTDSIFTVFTPQGFVAPTLEVRAVDDHGVRDPNPARQIFQFTNLPPIVKLTGKPNALDKSDTTFASVTVTWTVNDPDGNSNAVNCYTWLDGQAANPILVSGRSFTMPTSRFLTNGTITSGPRTLYIRGIDDGGMAGPADSVTWYVRQPVTGARARLLLVDEIPTSDPAKSRSDSLYANAITNAGLAPGTWRVLHLQSNQPFHSAKDLEQTFKQFEAVVWYRGENSTPSPVLTSYAIGPNGEGLGPYLDAGGHLMIESLGLTAAWSSNGPLPISWLRHYADCDGTVQFGALPDSSAAWGLGSSGVIYLPTLADSIQNKRIVGGLRGFVVRNASEVLALVPAHVMSQNNPIPLAVGVNVSQANNGRLILMTYPLVSGTISTPGFPQRSSLNLLKFYGLLGLTGP